MSDGYSAFLEFKQLVTSLRDWGFEVRDEEEFGEFSIGGFVCSYRFFGVLDVCFLRPGEMLADQVEPDMVLIWNGDAWEPLTDEESSQPLPNAEVFRTCVRTVNLMVAKCVGIEPDYCVVARSA
jgi:hypothetical protein